MSKGEISMFLDGGSKFMRFLMVICISFLILPIQAQKKKMKIPAYLKKGDLVSLVCTARKFTSEDAIPAKELLESWGLRVRLGATIDLDSCQLAGTDAERIADFQQQMDDPEVKAIWCCRGGYGTVRIIDGLDFTAFKKNPKWVIGFSDVTVLHSHLNTLRVASMHAIMPFTVPNAPDAVKESLRQSLFGEQVAYTYDSKGYDVIGQAEGELVGGNLSILYSLLGSPSAIDTKDKVLFIEDLDEYLYHLDRMMYNLKRNGYFKSLKGLVVGGMTKMHDNEIPFGQNAVGIIKSIAAEYNIPICFDFPAGHVSDNRTLIFGKRVHLNIAKDLVTLEYKN